MQRYCMSSQSEESLSLVLWTLDVIRSVPVKNFCFFFILHNESADTGSEQRRGEASIVTREQTPKRREAAAKVSWHQ